MTPVTHPTSNRIVRAPSRANVRHRERSTDTAFHCGRCHAVMFYDDAELDHRHCIYVCGVCGGLNQLQAGHLN
ncbi:MAG TPA: hypothetical protein VG650_16200 [Mycobacteriales bacterium]|nr:hypothetical protein [Mycobacteriales bacterium]